MPTLKANQTYPELTCYVTFSSFFNFIVNMCYLRFPVFLSLYRSTIKFMILKYELLFFQMTVFIVDKTYETNTHPYWREYTESEKTDLFTYL